MFTTILIACESCWRAAGSGVVHAKKKIGTGLSCLLLGTGLLTGSPPQVIDVLILYTPAVKAYYHGEDGITAHVLATMAASNQVIANSQIPMHLNLVAIKEIQYTETDSFSLDLRLLRTSGDHVLDEAQTWRREYQADLVSLFRRGSVGGVAGIAYQLENQFGSPDYAVYSVVSDESALSGFTFLHEIGHNLGAGHARKDPQFGGLFSYSNGFRFVGDSGNSFRTIMAYSPGRVMPFFSDPNIHFDGHPTGRPRDSQDSADNAHTLRISASIVSNYMKMAEAPDGVLQEIGAMNFGDIPIGSKIHQVITLRNTGPVPIEIRGFALPSFFRGFWVGTIPVGQERAVSIEFSPEDIIPYSGNLLIFTNIREAPYNVPLSANGISNGISPGDLLGQYEGWSWSTGGDVPWVSDHYDGIPIFRNGFVQQGQSSWLELRLTSTGQYLEVRSELTKCFSFSNHPLQARLVLYDQGGLQVSEWSGCEPHIYIPEGTFRLRWIFDRKLQVGIGGDHLLLRRVYWEGKPPLVDWVYPMVKTISATHGEKITLTVEGRSLQGSGPLRYQWYTEERTNYNQRIIPGATSSSLQITRSLYDVAWPRYFAEISNDVGSVFSNVFEITYYMERPAQFNIQEYVAVNYLPHIASDWSGTDVHIAWMTATGSHPSINNFLTKDFGLSHYFALNPDLIEAMGGYLYSDNLISHYFLIGKQEGRRAIANEDFDAQLYLQQNPDYKQRLSGLSAEIQALHALRHYIEQGHLEPFFPFSDAYNHNEYAALYPDVDDFIITLRRIAYSNENAKGFLHYLARGRNEGRWPRIPLMFTLEGYLQHNPDLAGELSGANHSRVQAWRHYIEKGIFENRSFDNTFRPSDYLVLNADLKSQLGNDVIAGLRHWVLQGKEEGRVARSQSGGSDPLPNPVPPPVVTPPPSFLTPLTAISTRGYVQTGERMMIGGFWIDGTEDKTVFIAARAGSLQEHGIPVGTILPNPVLAVFNAEGLRVLYNQGWRSNENWHHLQSRPGFRPSREDESAVIVKLAPGPYTVHVTGAVSSHQGIAIFEIYDVDAMEGNRNGSRLGGLSTRGGVSGGDGVIIAGLIVEEPGEYIITGRSHSMAPHLGPETRLLANPVVSRFDETGTLVATIDSLPAPQVRTEIETFTGVPLDSREVAAIVSLDRGVYTLHLRDRNGGEGVALIEIYRK